MGDGSSFSFNNDVSGAGAQINQGQNVTATQTNAGGEPTWADVATEAGEERAGDVAAIEELARTEAPDEDEIEAADSAMRRIGEASIDALKVAERIASKGVVAGSIMAARMLAERIAERT